MQLLDGKKIQNLLLLELEKEIKNLQTFNIIPKIVIIQVGEQIASSIYIKNKILLCQKNNIKCEHIHYPNTINENDLIEKINIYNCDQNINGILVQLPLPKHIDEAKIICAINPKKDVDGFNWENVGKLWTKKNNEQFDFPVACTAMGIIEIFKYYQIDLTGKNVTVIGRSNIVGKPLIALLMLANATVTICHSHSKNLIEQCGKSEILIVAVGKAKFITQQYTNSNQIIIDVGINRDQENKTCGDVDFINVQNHVAALTPVPGGVGVLTTTILLRNLILLTKQQNRLK